MRWLILITGVVLVVSGLYLRWQEPPDGPLSVIADPLTERQTATGPVMGGVAPAGAQVWLGIPYAEAPQGALRWKAPRPGRSWLQPRPATDFGEVCPQYASRFSGGYGKAGTLIGNEDCLSLNVFAPAGVGPGAALPVMVFIHGGGNTIGSAQPYNGADFVQEQGVLMVTLNYRLGVLGWFSHEALRETADNARDASGNFGLLDIIAALTWVRDNIASFGGDPGRVTLFGESAGGRNIYSLLATPLAGNLFHGAIIQSGFPGTFSRERAENSRRDPQPGHRNSSHELSVAWLQAETSRTVVEVEASLVSLPADEFLGYLRGLSLREVMAPVAVEGGLYEAPALFRDGAVLPEDPLPEVFADPARWNRVPLLVGTNRDEMKLFLATSDRHVSQRFGLLPTVRDSKNYNRLSVYFSDNWKATGVDLPLSVINGASPDLPVFAYRFDWDDTLDSWLADLPDLLGASRGLELDFLFGPLVARAVPGVFHGGNKAGRTALGAAIRDYWGGFAYTGRPGSGRSSAQAPWPRWQQARPLVMLLDEVGDGGVRAEELSITVDDVKAALASDEAFTGRQRCALYVDMYLNNRGLEELFKTREYQRLGCGQFPAWSLAGTGR